jgi:hypothetical protein
MSEFYRKWRKKKPQAQNTKSEARNKFKIQNNNAPNQSGFGHWDFLCLVLVSEFSIRYSCLMSFSGQ